MCCMQFTPCVFSVTDTQERKCFVCQLKQRLKDQGLDENIRLSWKKQPDGEIFHKDKRETKKRNTFTEKEEL